MARVDEMERHLAYLEGLVEHLVKDSQRPAKEHDHAVLDVLTVLYRFTAPAGSNLFRADALQENYNTGDDNDNNWFGAGWGGQTFTVVTGHNCIAVKLKLYRSGTPGTPGTITASIRETDGNGFPTGADLASGTYDGNTLSSSSPGAFVEIRFTGAATLLTGKKYAIVIRAPSGDANSQLHWRIHFQAGTYTTGNEVQSADSGSSWSNTNNDNDAMFEEYAGSLKKGTSWVEGS